MSLKSASFLLLAIIVLSSDAGKHEFDAWKGKFDKFYAKTSAENRARRRFERNFAFVESFNRFHAAKTGFRMVPNHLSDRYANELENNGASFSVIPADNLKSGRGFLDVGYYYDFDPEFEDWKARYDRHYLNDVEDVTRYAAFKRTRAMVNENNADPKRTYDMILNQFADWSKAEFDLFLPKIIGLSPLLRLENDAGDGGFNVTVETASSSEPGEVIYNWTSKLGPAVNQNPCGGCYAFAAVGGMVCRRNMDDSKEADKTWMSTQQILDCTKSYGNKGCNGGNSHITFDYLKKLGGINTDSTYPFVQKDDPPCKFKWNDKNIPLAGKIEVKANDEGKMIEALKTGCVVAYIDATPSFMSYHKGVYVPKEGCSKTEVNHAIVVVGVTENAWIVRNSWGSDWGEDGNIYMARSPKNVCGILTYGVYPVLKK